MTFGRESNSFVKCVCIPCFAADAAVYTLDCGNHAILALSRESKNERITAMFNFSDKKQCVHFSTQEAEVLEPYEMKLCTGYLNGLEMFRSMYSLKCK